MPKKCYVLPEKLATPKNMSFGRLPFSLLAFSAKSGKIGVIS
jgi:hypothetical protein